jgi:chromosome partitioning protein
MDTMLAETAAQAASPLAADELVAHDADILGSKLQEVRARLFPPEARKGLRTFSSGEAAKLVGVSDAYLRQLDQEGEGPRPEKTTGGRRRYTLPQVDEIRRLLSSKPNKREYVPHRRDGEHLQVIAIANFKGGSAKTTTAAHLAQHLAMRGYRVLGVDLDPQASLSSQLGYQPEVDFAGNDTMYAALRWELPGKAEDEPCRLPLRDVILKTYFHGLDFVPGNLELQEFEFETPQAMAGKAPGSKLFFARLKEALDTVSDSYDVVVIDCPPQLGFLTLNALCAATSLLVTVHPQMLDVSSMCQFLNMTGSLMAVVRQHGGSIAYDWQRYLITRYEQQDGPQTRMVALLRHLFGERVLTNAMVKSTAVSDAGISKRTVYESMPRDMNQQTYERAVEALDAVNGEIAGLIEAAWGRSP